MKFELIGDGRNRRVFRHGNYVIKLPLNNKGVDDNYHEASVWRKYGHSRGYINYARCRLLGGILVMQYVGYLGKLSDKDGYIHLHNIPEWAYAVDCWQVGYNRFGNIVAYDYGIH